MQLVEVEVMRLGLDRSTNSYVVILQEKGGHYSKGADWSSYAVTDGLLVTGQNPQSSEAAAEALLGLLRK